jgi:Spy/CpxP family protein refolding chaperone
VTEPAKGADQPRPERKAEGANEGEQAVDEAKAREAREQLLAIVEGAPKAADAHAAMVAVLTEEQKTYVKQQGEKMREQLREGQGRGEGRMQGRGEGEGPRLTEEQREKLRNMTPEERREFLRTLREERGKDGKPGKQGKEGKAPKQEGKPAEGDDQMMDPR